MGSLCCSNRYLAIQVPSFDLNIAHNCGIVLIIVLLEQMKVMFIHGVGKNVFQLEGLLETNLQLEPWRRMKDKWQWPLTKVVMLISYIVCFLPKKYKLLYTNCLQI